MQRHLVTVWVLSHNELVREGLKRLLAEGGFAAECIATAELQDRIDDLPDDPKQIFLIEAETAAAAIETAAMVRNGLSNVRLALLTAKCERADVRSAITMGVDAYLSIVTQHLPLLLMLDLVSLGEKVYPRQFLEDVVAREEDHGRQHWARIKPMQDLSRREFAILKCLVDGDPNKVIARKLGIAEATVKIHVKAILRKLNVMNRTQAAIWMISNAAPDGADGVPAGM